MKTTDNPRVAGIQQATVWPERVHVGTLALIEDLQIYTVAQADLFLRDWRREIDYLRFEWATLPGSAEKMLAVDMVLRSQDGQRNLIVFGVLTDEDGVHFPALLQNWPPEDLAHLRDVILGEIANPARNLEIRALHPAPRLPVDEMTIERVLPGMRDYLTREYLQAALSEQRDLYFAYPALASPPPWSRRSAALLEIAGAVAWMPHRAQPGNSAPA